MSTQRAAPLLLAAASTTFVASSAATFRRDGVRDCCHRAHRPDVNATGSVAMAAHRVEAPKGTSIILVTVRQTRLCRPALKPLRDFRSEPVLPCVSWHAVSVWQPLIRFIFLVLYIYFFCCLDMRVQQKSIATCGVHTPSSATGAHRWSTGGCSGEGVLQGASAVTKR